jgi:hypothetical protein
MKIYKTISLVTSAAFIYSFSQHLFNSGSITDLGLQSSEATYFLARRASIFPLGLAILLFLSRNLPHSKARQYICLSTGFILVGYACIGSYDLIVGTVNSLILVPIIIEVVLGVSFLAIFFKSRKAKIAQ